MLKKAIKLKGNNSREEERNSEEQWKAKKKKAICTYLSIITCKWTKYSIQKA